MENYLEISEWKVVKNTKKDIENLQQNDFIKYSIDNKMRAGGFLWKAFYPNYLRLRSSNGFFWNVWLENDALVLYKKVTNVKECSKNEFEKMKEVYEMYQKGLLIKTPLKRNKNK